MSFIANKKKDHQLFIRRAESKMYEYIFTAVRQFSLLKFLVTKWTNIKDILYGHFSSSQEWKLCSVVYQFLWVWLFNNKISLHYFPSLHMNLFVFGRWLRSPVFNVSHAHINYYISLLLLLSRFTDATWYS